MRRYASALKQFIQFNIVGVLNTAVDFLVFTLLTQIFGVSYIMAKVISYSCGIINSYVINTSWTFKRERKRTKREMLLFLIVNVASLGVSLGVMYICRTVLNIESDLYCNLIATPIALIINFTGNKLCVFRGEE